MARFARVVAVGVPHHVTQRGNNRQALFQSDQDRMVYLKLLREQSDRHRLRVWGYCLMGNHVHVIAAPLREESLARTLRQAHAAYARYANVKRSACGHLWQNRYFSCPMDDGYCWTALAYVERNPVRAGFVSEAAHYPWSSAGAHLAGRDATGWLDLSDWGKTYDPNRWREVLRTSVNEEAESERIREATRTGRPLGAREFVQTLEDLLRRQLEPGKRGRRPRVASSTVEQPELFLEAAGIGD